MIYNPVSVTLVISCHLFHAVLGYYKLLCEET